MSAHFSTNTHSLSSILNPFIFRQIKAKEVFCISPIHKTDAYDFVKEHHYLGSAKFFSQYNFGLFIKDTNILVGVATFSSPQGGYSLRGWFNISNEDSTILELSRLCVIPILNGSNATSYLLSNCIKILKKHRIRAVITLADSSRHVGSIYQVCNFKYYGLTPERSIFYTDTGKKNPRITGKKYIHGVWINMPQKHRYAYVMDKSLKVCHKEEAYPKKCEVQVSDRCIGCGGTYLVYDKRFDEYYTCPYCVGKVKKVPSDMLTSIYASSDKLSFLTTLVMKECPTSTEVALW